MSGIANYFKESYNELVNHVTWPTWAEAQKSAVVVAIFSILFSLLIWGIDTVFSKAISGYFNWIQG